MAARKKPVDTKPEPDDVAKAKQEVANDAKAVTDAVSALNATQAKTRFGRSPLEDEWSNMRNSVNQMDREFQDVELRVMQYGPNGQLTDVSDKVNPRDVRPEQIEGFTSTDGSVRLPRKENGQVDHDAAMDLFGRLLGISRGRTSPSTETVSTAAIREMEALLAESDTILKKLRR